jgi:hypothetical protein
MKQLFLIMLLVLAFAAIKAQNSGGNASDIRKQMATIRQSTDWDDPVAAKKANEQIRELSKKLMVAGKAPADLPNNLSKEEADRAKEDAVDDKMKMIGQIMKSVAGGEGADILLGEPVREEIVEDYQKDDDKTIQNSEFLQSMTFLLINMSMPGIDLVIKQMPNFKGIKMLVIISGGKAVSTDFQTILNNAKGYPLESLYITDFGIFLDKIPPQVFKFSNLQKLGIYNNKINSLPPEMESFANLKELYVDVNPITTLSPWIAKLSNLQKLGIGNTKISTTDIAAIKTQLPNCQILEK